MLKIETKKGITTVRQGESVKFVGTLTEAITYVFYKRFVALVCGEEVITRLNTIYPVRSLLPPIGEKTVKVYILEGEIKNGTT